MFVVVLVVVVVVVDSKEATEVPTTEFYQQTDLKFNLFYDSPMFPLIFVFCSFQFLLVVAPARRWTFSFLYFSEMTQIILVLRWPREGDI